LATSGNTSPGHAPKPVAPANPTQKPKQASGGSSSIFSGLFSSKGKNAPGKPTVKLPVNLPAGSPPPSGPPPKKRDSRIEKLKKHVGGFLFQLLTLALFLTAFGWWGYTQVMKQVLGRFDVLDWESAGASLYGAPNVLLIDPIRTEEFLRPDTARHDTIWPYQERFDEWPLLDTLWYAPGIPHHSREGFEAWDLLGTDDFKQAGLADPWKELLFRKKIAFTLEPEPALAAIPDGVNMVILPGCLLLSADERKGVKDFLVEGGKLLFCWSPGCRDENGNWTGYTFLEQIVGGTLAGLVQDPTGGETIMLNGAGPITAMIPPGLHLEFFTWNGNIELNIREPRTTADAWQFESYWHNGGKTAGAFHPAMAAHGTYVAGKFVWFSFTPDAMQPHKDNNAMMERLALNAVNWLAGKPLIDISVWPPGYSAGGSLVVNGEGTPGTIAQIQNSIDVDQKPLDVIIDPDNVPDIVDFYGPRWGDVIIGSADTALFNSLNPRDIFDWLASSSTRIETITGKRPRGLFPPNWDYSEFAAVGAATEKMRFVMCSPNPRFYGPTESLLRPHGWWIFSDKVQLATLPKSQVSSDEWVDYGRIKGAAGLYSAMSNNIRHIRKFGGMYIGILDPNTLEAEEATGLGAKLAAYMDSSGVWRGSIGEVMDRFSGWRGLRVGTMEVTPKRLQVQLSNESDVTMTDVKLDVYFTPDVIASVEVTSQVLGLRPTNITWNRRTGLFSFALPEVTAGMNAVIFLDAATDDEKREESK